MNLLIFNNNLKWKGWIEVVQSVNMQQLLIITIFKLLFTFNKKINYTIMKILIFLFYIID